MSKHDVYRDLLDVSNKPISECINEENCPIYHYTSPTGLNGIITKHTLRFTDRNYLNDYSEGRYVLDLCLASHFEELIPDQYRKYFKDTCEKIHKNLSIKKRYVYQCSFSLDNDNLALWNYYTKNEGVQGYNLGFTSNDLEEKIITNRDLSPSNRVKVCGSRVVYNLETQKKIIENIVEDFSSIIVKNEDNTPVCKLAIELLIEKILQIGSFFKKDCFKIEKEYRLLIFLVAIWGPDTKCIEFMCLDKGASTYEKNGLLIPYIDIEFERDALKEIIISPTLSIEEVSGNIRNALKLHSFNTSKITIAKSNIPIRY